MFNILNISKKINFINKNNILSFFKIKNSLSFIKINFKLFTNNLSVEKKPDITTKEQIYKKEISEPHIQRMKTVLLTEDLEQMKKFLSDFFELDSPQLNLTKFKPLF